MFETDEKIFGFVKGKLYVAVVCDVLDSLGFREQAMHHRLRPLLPDMYKCGFVGRARTVHWMAVEYANEADPYGLEIDVMDTHCDRAMYSSTLPITRARMRRGAS